MPAFDDNSNVIKSGARAVSLMRRPSSFNLDDKVEYRPLGNSFKDSQLFVNIKIYFAYLKDQYQFVFLEELGNMTLLDVLKKMNNLPYKNPEMFYFVEHYTFDGQNDYFEDEVLNEINLNTQLKYLNSHELDVNN